MTAQEFLERENIDDSDFMDSGMTNTIAALMDKYHEEKVLRFLQEERERLKSILRLERESIHQDDSDINKDVTSLVLHLGNMMQKLVSKEYNT